MNRYILITITSIFICCQEAPKKNNRDNILTQSQSQGWENLSNQDSFEGWHIYQNESGTKSGWTVEEGIFTFDENNAEGEGNKSLLTDSVYSSFEIEFEWKLSPNSNSGFMWGVSEDMKYEHPHVTGPEIQIIDAEVYGDDPKHQVHNVGALYDMIPPNSIAAKKAGSWNKYHIKVDHKKNEALIILNEVEINRFPLSGEEWDDMVKKSKFSNMSGFAKYKEGHICLQDHPGLISYKNIKIKRL